MTHSFFTSINSQCGLQFVNVDERTGKSHREGTLWLTHMGIMVDINGLIHHCILDTGNHRRTFYIIASYELTN